MQFNQLNKKKLALYLSSVVVYGAGILLFRFLPYYQRTIRAQAFLTMLVVWTAYVIFAPVVYFFSLEDPQENKPFLILRAFTRNLRAVVGKEVKFRIIDEEKAALLFMGVKLFFFRCCSISFLRILACWQQKAQKLSGIHLPSLCFLLLTHLFFHWDIFLSREFLGML